MNFHPNRKHKKGNYSMSPDQSEGLQYNRRTSDRRLSEIESKLTSWTIKLTTAAAVGVLCWGGISWFLVDKLTQINKSIEQWNTTQGEVALLKYQQSEQVRINTQLVNQLERSRDIFENLQMRLTRLEADTRTQ